MGAVVAFFVIVSAIISSWSHLRNQGVLTHQKVRYNAPQSALVLSQSPIQYQCSGGECRPVSSPVYYPASYQSQPQAPAQPAYTWKKYVGEDHWTLMNGQQVVGTAKDGVFTSGGKVMTCPVELHVEAKAKPGVTGKEPLKDPVKEPPKETGELSTGQKLGNGIDPAKLDETRGLTTLHHRGKVEAVTPTEAANHLPTPSGTAAASEIGNYNETPRLVVIGSESQAKSIFASLNTLPKGTMEGWVMQSYRPGTWHAKPLEDSFKGSEKYSAKEPLIVAYRPSHKDPCEVEHIWASGATSLLNMVSWGNQGRDADPNYDPKPNHADVLAVSPDSSVILGVGALIGAFFFAIFVYFKITSPEAGVNHDR